LPASLRFALLGLCLVSLGYSSLRADAPGNEDHKVMAAKIDQRLADRWAQSNVQPAPLADDAEFLRRVYLDIAGHTPSVAEARAFLKDMAPDKRQRLVDKLLNSPRYVTHFTNFWRSLLMPEASTGIQARLLVPGFEAWLRVELGKNRGYDEMVRELLTVQVDPKAMRGRIPTEPTPVAFYLAKEMKAENLAAGVSRLFMGIRLECAQCHNHPVADWKREQFWGLAAFFAGVQGRTQDDFTMPVAERTEKREIGIPGTDKVVQANYLDGSEPQWKYKVSPRKTMSEWLTSPDNPYFARALVNRMWATFFGAGIVEPVDEMVGANNSISHPELLDELAKDFAAHRFDLKYLIRVITSTRAYQLTSAGKAQPQAASESAEEVRLFERMPVRGLTPEQLFDSVVQATGHREPFTDPRAIFFNNNGDRAQFLSTFADQGTRPAEVQTSIPQALLLLNGNLIARATSLEGSETLAAIMDSPFLTTTQRIETLYLAALSRLPRQRELDRLVAFIERRRPQEQKTAVADVFWVLLNSSEFMLNH
jgi:hypothetical protein